MNFTQNQKIKGAKDLAELSSIAENPKMQWTDDRIGLFVDQADGIVASGEDVCQLATKCLELDLGNKLLIHFARKLGINDLDTLKLYLAATKSEKAVMSMFEDMIGPIIGKTMMGLGKDEIGLDSLHEKVNKLHQTTQQTQADILAIAAHLLAVPSDAGLDQIGKVANIAGELVAGSKERLLLEEATTDSALPKLRSISEIPLYAKRNLGNNSQGVCTLIAAYAQQKLDQFPDAALLLDMIDGPVEMAPDDLASMIKSTRLEIYKVAAEFLSKNGHEATLDQLMHFAHAISPLKDDGSDTEQLENTVNAVALKKIDNSQQATEMAGAYKTKSGTHRFLAAYLANLGGRPFAQDDLDLVAGSIKNRKFGGDEVLDKLVQLAEQRELKFDKERAIKEIESGGLFPGMGALLSALSGSDAGEIVMMSGKCNCVNCQIDRLIGEDIKNSYLAGEWDDIKTKLESLGVLEILDERNCYLSCDMATFEQAMDQCGVSDVLREILHKAFDPKESTGIPAEIAMMMAREGGFPGEGVMVEVVVKSTPSPDKLREELEKHLQAGDLATHKFMTSGGPMTVKEMAAVDPDSAHPELLEVAKEYASKID